MEQPPVRRYLIYSVLLSILLILAILLYQHLTIVNRTTMDISKNLIDFTILNYSYEGGKYTIYMVPTDKVTISEISVNEDHFKEFSGSLDKNSPISLEGESTGELIVKVIYKTTGLEHTGYAIIPEK